MRWRLHKDYFKGAGPYTMGAGDKTLSIEVDADGIFNFDGEQKLPLYVFATKVGSRKDDDLAGLRLVAARMRMK